VFPLTLLDNREKRIRYWWPLVLLVAALAYGYQLGGLHIPKIGDENVYFQITKRTADTGHWLPLQAADGLENTKPPLLTWQGLVTTGWGKHWTLVRLRLPSLWFTTLVSLLVFLLAQRISRDRETAFIATASFLAFSSTFQHGRPYLVNMPETLFVFLPAFLLLYFKNDKRDWRLWLLAGVSLGMASLYKSFALIVPALFSLGWMQLSLRGFDFGKFFRQDSARLLLAGVIALAIFSVWPLLDPDPKSIFENFILGENATKLSRGDYFSGLFSGPYPVWRIWLGHLTNAGLIAVPLAWVAIGAIRNRKSLPEAEKLLWIFVLGFLMVFTVPAQRQENYLLATIPALSILIGLNWQRISKTGLLVSYLPVLLSVFIILFLMTGIDSRVLPGAYGATGFLPPVLALLLIAAGATSCRHTDKYFHLVLFLCFLSLSSLLSPFEAAHGRYSNETQRRLAGQTVYMPSNFRSRYERYRFLLPLDTRVIGYAAGDNAAAQNYLDSGAYVGVYVAGPLSKNTWPGYEVVGQRLDIRTRQTDEEVRQILTKGRFDLLFHHEVILKRKTLKG